MNSSKIWILVILVLVILCCFVSLCFISVGGLAIWAAEESNNEFTPLVPSLDLYQDPEVIIGVTPMVEVVRDPVESGEYETLETLQDEIVPINDPRNLAERLEGKQNIPEIYSDVPQVFEIGDLNEFWVSNTDTNESFTVNTTLAYKTDHVYFWVEDGVRYNSKALNKLVDTFEENIYPTNREFFGSEWTPGIDSDPHLFILFVRGIGSGIAGYFSSADSVHPLAHEFSNAREMFVLNADNIDLDSDFTKGVLAHEFQHMIHWYQDRNEETWLNEGFSELASFLNGYDVGGFDYVFIDNPDIQLTDWPDQSYATTPHYGAAFLFVTYFLDRFGDVATQELVSNPDNGMDSVDQVLRELNQVDQKTGTIITADNVFSDWVVANYLQDSRVEDGRYGYSNYPNAPQAYDTETIEDCGTSWEARSVSQYGADYIRVKCPGTYDFQFEGSTKTNVMAEDPYSGQYAFWSNKGDESHMILSREFDFTKEAGPITLRFRTWYDLETDYDYLYLTATETGETWEIIRTPLGTDVDPSGNSFGWAYNGQSGEWVLEEVDLSKFAGKKVRIQFEYVTDAAVNGEGLLIDDVEIPEINYFSDFEEDDGGWVGEGFVRIQNRLPQKFVISKIELDKNIKVDTYMIGDDGTISIPIVVEEGSEGVMLAISGTTRFTRQFAAYQFALQPTE